MGIGITQYLVPTPHNAPTTILPRPSLSGTVAADTNELARSALRTSVTVGLRAVPVTLLVNMRLGTAYCTAKVARGRWAGSLFAAKPAARPVHSNHRGRKAWADARRTYRLLTVGDFITQNVREMRS